MSTGAAVYYICMLCLCVCEIVVNVDEAVVSQLMDMGFPRNACIKGVHFSNNTGIEAAMNWIMEHVNDLGSFKHCN